MMRTFIKTGIIWGGILLSLPAWGQSHIPLGALPMQYNGSFAGESGTPRIALNSHYGYRSIHDAIKSNTFQSLLSYDQFISALSTGIGFSADFTYGSTKGLPNYQASGSDFSSEGTKQIFTLNVAPKLSIKGKYSVSPSISVSYSDQSWESNLGIYKTEGFTSKIGLLFNSPKYYVGYSVDGPTTFRINGLKEPYRFVSYLQLGYTFQRTETADFSFTPQVVILASPSNKSQHYSIISRHLFAYNFNFRYKKFLWGVNNAGIHIGMQTESFRLMLTNDAGYFSDDFRRNLPDHKAYNGNLSLRYSF